jgi:hypothetical protein
MDSPLKKGDFRVEIKIVTPIVNHALSLLENDPYFNSFVSGCCNMDHGIDRDMDVYRSSSTISIIWLCITDGTSLILLANSVLGNGA